MRARTLYYGWFDRRQLRFRVSRLPPDAPVRPSLEFASKADVLAMIARKRGEILWSPPLHEHEKDYQGT